MAERDVFVVATLSVIAAIGGHGGADPLAGHPEIAPYLEPSQLQTLTLVNPNRSSWFEWEATTASLRLLRERGITILAGSDPPNVGAAYGAGVHRELELLVEAGLTPLEALAAATAAPARVFGLEDRGRIAPGLRADLLLVAGDPTADITATRDIAAVWKRGVRFDRAAFRELLARVVESDARRAALPIGPRLLSGFDGDSIEAAFGYGWHAASDVIDDGRSIAAINLVSGGALGTRGALHVEGNLVAGANAWAGVAFRPGAEARLPGDLSGVTGLSFWARGDARTYQVRITSPGAQGARVNATVAFTAGNEWREYTFDLSAFEGIDPNNVLWLAIAAGPEPGPFAFQIDEVRLR